MTQVKYLMHTWMIYDSTCVNLRVMEKLYMNLFVTIVNNYCFMLHSNFIFYLNIYFIYNFGDQNMCESIIIHCTMWIEKITNKYCKIFFQTYSSFLDELAMKTDRDTWFLTKKHENCFLIWTSTMHMFCDNSQSYLIPIKISLIWEWTYGPYITH